MSARPASSNPEAERLKTLHALRLLDTPREERFDRLTRLAGALLDAPIAVVSLVDEKRVWYKSVFGLRGLSEVPRALSFCEAAVLAEGTDPFVVSKTARDKRFAGHPLVAGPARIRFYAAQPLSSGGLKIGTLSIMDRRNRDFPLHRQRQLADLAALVEQELMGITLRETRERLAAAERRAEEQHARFAAFMDHLPNAAFMKDAAGRAVYVNRHYREVFHLEAQAVLGKRDDEWLPPDVAAKIINADRAIFATGKPSVTAEIIPTAIGLRHWLTFKFPIPTASGEQLLGGVAVDITELKNVEQQLQELSALQRAILDSANFSIISTDCEGVIRSFNAGSERLLGYTAEEVIGKLTPTVFHEPRQVERHAAALSAQLGRTIEPGPASIRWGVEDAQSVEGEWTFIRKDGERFLATLSLTALRDAGGIASGYVGIMRDITLERHAEDALLHAKEAAEAANRAKSAFVANMSHEVRTPLNGILGVTGMMLEGDLSPDQRQLAEVVRASGEGLLAIVNDILDFSKVEAGKIEMERIEFDLAATVGAVVELNTARALEKCLTIEADLHDDVPRHLQGDPLRLRQVLNNLVGNAIKFSDHGQVRIMVTSAEQRDSGAMLRFAVTDCGIGVSPAQQAHIFDAFTQADVSTTRRYGGTGLGLSICRQLVALMNGQMTLESDPGRGSTFSFTALFPLASPAELHAIDAPEPEPLPKMRVLLAEDSAINRLVAIHQLHKLGCDVEVVENGRQALDALETAAFDLVLMDCQMPIMDGYAATAEIRRRERSAFETGSVTRHLRIIALTANAMTGERERCFSVGMDGYLAKPFKAGDLYTVISSVLQGTESPGYSEADLHGDTLDRATLARLREECRDGAADHFTDYVLMFREDAAQALDELARAEAGRLAETLRLCVHRLRGAAANFGAHRLMRLCAQAEEHVVAESPASAFALIPALRDEISQVEQALSVAAPASDPKAFAAASACAVSGPPAPTL